MQTDRMNDHMNDSVALNTELLYRQIYRQIADDIANGALPSGERLPSERELSDRLSVSRATVRRALKQLVADGLVESRQGAGTFVVSTGPLGEAPNALMSFTELGASRGLKASSTVLSAEVRRATLDEGELFGVAPGIDIFVLERIRFLDGLPISVDGSRIPLTYAPHLPDIDFSSASLYGSLRDAGAGPVRADYTVEAVAADAVAADRLAVDPGAALLLTRTSSYDHRRRLVEIGEMLFRGDRYRFRASLMRRRW
jgi:GntR family transcriptional regulator